MKDQPVTPGNAIKLVVYALLLLPAIVFGAGAVAAVIFGTGYYLMRKQADFAYLRTSIRFVMAALAVGTLVGAVVTAYEYYPFSSFGISQEINAEFDQRRNAVENPELVGARFDDFRRAREQRDETLAMIELERDRAAEAALNNTFAGRIGLDRFLSSRELLYDRYYAGQQPAFVTSILFGYLLATFFLLYQPLMRSQERIVTHGLFPAGSRSQDPAPTGSANIIRGENLKNYSVADELAKWVALKEAGHVSEEEFNKARTKLLS